MPVLPANHPRPARPGTRWRCALLRVLAVAVFGSAPAAQAAHPLITEDTGTQGQGHFQIELTGEHIRTRQQGFTQYIAITNAVLAYGFTETADVVLTLPYLRLGQAADGTPGAAGLADTGLDLKWRFYELGPLSLALKPGLTFATGDETRHLGSGEARWSLYLVTSYQPAPWAFHLHLGHLHHNNTFNERVDLWHASLAATRRFGEALTLIVDAGIDSNTDPTLHTDPLFAIAGFIWSPRADFDLDFGIKTEHTHVHRTQALLAGLTWRW
jgi:hypothetical protein